MKINELLGQIKAVKPNPYSDEILLTWINDCEAKVRVFIQDALPATYKKYKLPEDGNKELFLPNPFDECYSLYLQAYIDYQMQEIESYNNTMVMYNNALSEAKKYFVRNGENRDNRLKVVL